MGGMLGSTGIRKEIVAECHVSESPQEREASLIRRGGKTW